MITKDINTILSNIIIKQAIIFFMKRNESQLDTINELIFLIACITASYINISECFLSLRILGVGACLPGLSIIQRAGTLPSTPLQPGIISVVTMF